MDNITEWTGLKMCEALNVTQISKTVESITLGPYGHKKSDHGKRERQSYRSRLKQIRYPFNSSTADKFNHKYKQPETGVRPRNDWYAMGSETSADGQSAAKTESIRDTSPTWSTPINHYADKLVYTAAQQEVSRLYRLLQKSH